MTKSLKVFSHGRGLAAHLHAVHTPWKPGKAEVKRRNALYRRQENDKRRVYINEKGVDDVERCSKKQKTEHDDSALLSWHPTVEERTRWNEQVAEIVALTEAEANRNKVNGKSSLVAKQGCDRNGKEHGSYRDSLPAFLAAAAEGDLNTLQNLVNNNIGDKNDHIRVLLSLKDRNGSSAEHWAAGGGHKECIRYLWEIRDRLRDDDVADTDIRTKNRKKKVRRRDGKTALHYAARNGRDEMIDLILSQKDAPSVDITSGDGTTPLHMACYGGHFSTVKHLIESHHADAFAMNEWNCGVAHFAAMSVGEDGTNAVIELCKYLKHDCGVDFTSRQKQGHTPLHKAASRKNRHVIEWLADETKSLTQDLEAMGKPDDGGNSPSTIWLSVGGDEEFGGLMKKAWNW